MIESACHDGNLRAEPALDLIGNRKGQQEIRTAGVDVLGDGEDGPEIVGGMAQAAYRQIGVQQIGIAHQDRVEERRLIHRGPPAADECRGGAPAEFLGLLADRRDELTVQGTERAGDAVQHVSLEHRP